MSREEWSTVTVASSATRKRIKYVQISLGTAISFSFLKTVGVQQLSPSLSQLANLASLHAPRYHAGASYRPRCKNLIHSLKGCISVGGLFFINLFDLIVITKLLKPQSVRSISDVHACNILDNLLYFFPVGRHTAWPLHDIMRSNK